MKKVVAVSILVISFLNCTYTLKHYEVYDRQDVIVFTKEIGEVIDAEEREKYDLFPGVEGFREARFYGIAGGGYEVEVITDRGRSVSVNRDVRAWQILTDYFLQYNSQRYNEAVFEERWKIIDYDALGFPITQHEYDSNTKAYNCCGCGGGCGLVFLGGSLFLAWGYGLDHKDDIDQGAVNRTCALIVASGVVAGLLIGALAGRTVDQKRALDNIKRHREPRPVEMPVKEN